MGKLLLALFLLATLPTISHSQESGKSSLFFSEAIGKNIRKYRINSRKAYIRKDEDRAQFLFDSLVNHVVKNTYLDNFKVRKFSGRKVSMNDFEKPMYLITYASWCTPGIGEIPALNDIVDAHYQEIDFVMLFWGSKKKIRQMKRGLNNKITVLYVDEKENRSDFVIRCMKHSLGFPTSFFIDADKKILDVRRNFFHPYSEDYTSSYNNNYQTYSSGISLLTREE